MSIITIINQFEQQRLTIVPPPMMTHPNMNWQISDVRTG